MPGEHARGRGAARGRRGASGTRTTNSLRYARRVDPRARRPPRGPPRAPRPVPRPSPRRRAARAARWSRGRPTRRARAAPGWCRCCEAAFSRRMSCSRARIVITNARRPSRSGSCPTSRPGIWRTRASVQATIPRYGPPYWSGIPSGWPSPPRCRRRTRRAARGPRATPARSRDEQRAGGMGRVADRRHGLEQAEDVGLRRDDARRPGAPASASSRASASRSVVPASGPSATSGISSTVRPGPVGVGRERLAVVRMDRRATPAAARDGSRGRSSARPRRSRRRRRSATRTPRRAPVSSASSDWYS